MNIDISFNKFDAFLDEYESLKAKDISESDTRSKVIDRVFIDLLGWKEEDIQREGHLDTGFYDYCFSIPGFFMIVEAKKQYVDINLPTNTKKVSLRTIYKENEGVINQIRGYTSDIGVDYGIITNGHQFIIGCFVNHNKIPWKNNQVLIFNGFSDIKNRYIEFYNNLAKPCIIQNGGFQFLIRETEASAQKIVSTLIDRDKEIVRNDLGARIAENIEIIFGEIFNDSLENREEFIKECFVENKETIKNKDELNRLFDDSPPRLEEVVKARNLKNLTDQINAEIRKSPTLAKESSAPKPVIIVGTKGAGKTTFINYLFNNSLPESTLKDHPFVYIDFIKYYTEDKTIDTEKISNDILEDLYERYEPLKLHSLTVLKRIYFKEIARNESSVWGDLMKDDPKGYSRRLNEFLEEKSNSKQSHLEFLSRYLIRERRLRLIIIIDNADQFDIETQERVFLFANSLNRNANCGIFIALREGYYYKWRFRPPFNAFVSNVYHVTAPPYSQVLQKRINYTLKKLSISDKSSGYTPTGYKIELSNQNIIEFMRGLQDSLFEDNNQALIDFLNYSTFPNIREGLKLFKLFLVSGYTDVKEYILRVRFSQQEARITIPIHEFVKSIGLFNKLYYNHEISSIPNLFYPCENCQDHFFKLWILKYLQKKLEEGGNIGKFERYLIVVEDFSNYGYRIDIINKTLSELLLLEFIESDEMLTDIKWQELPDKEFNISITPKGYYYIKEIKNRFYYIDLILQDTPIYDEESFSRIKSTFPRSDENGFRDLPMRVSTVKCFMEYLKTQEGKQSRAVISKFGSIVNEIMSDGLDSDLNRIANYLSSPKKK